MVDLAARDRREPSQSFVYATRQYPISTICVTEAERCSLKLDGNNTTVFVSSKICHSIRQATVIDQMVVCLSDLSVARPTHFCNLLKRQAAQHSLRYHEVP